MEFFKDVAITHYTDHRTNVLTALRFTITAASRRGLVLALLRSRWRLPSSSLNLHANLLSFRTRRYHQVYPNFIKAWHLVIRSVLVNCFMDLTHYDKFEISNIEISLVVMVNICNWWDNSLDALKCRTRFSKWSSNSKLLPGSVETTCPIQ